MTRNTWPLSFRKSTVVASIRVWGGQSFLRGFCQRISLTLNLLVFILILRMEICEGGAVRQLPEHPGVDPNEKRNGYRG